MTVNAVFIPCLLMIALLATTLYTDCCEALANGNKKRSRKKEVQKSPRGFGIVIPPTIEPSYAVDESSSIKNLLKFLDDEEVEGFDTLEIGYSQTGLRGVFAKESIEQGEYICAIPFVSTILVDETFVESSDNDDDLLSANKIEHAIKFHKILETETEKWKAYFACLPTQNDDNFDATPDFWSDEEIKSLAIPSLVENILDRKQEIQKMSVDTGIDMEKLHLAAWLIQSRAFTTLKKAAVLDPDNPYKLTKEGILQRTVLIPFIDFLNHASTSSNAEMQVVSTEAYDESFYALVANRKIPKGKEVRIQYGTGKETSWDLLAKYGFLPKGNQANDLEYLRNNHVLSVEDIPDPEKLEHQTARSLSLYLKTLLSKM